MLFTSCHKETIQFEGSFEGLDTVSLCTETELGLFKHSYRSETVPRQLLSDQDAFDSGSMLSILTIFSIIILADEIMGLLCDSVESQIKHIVSHKVYSFSSMNMYENCKVISPDYQNHSLYFAQEMIVTTPLGALFLVQKGRLPSCYKQGKSLPISMFQKILVLHVAKMTWHLRSNLESSGSSLRLPEA